MRTSYVIISVALLFAPQTKATVYFETWTGGMYHWSGSSYTQVMGALSPTTLMGWSSYEPNYGLRVPALVVAPSGTVYSSITVQNYFGTTITESTYSSAREVVRLAEHYSTGLAMDSEGYIYSLGTDGSIYKVSPSGSATLFGNLPGAVALTLVQCPLSPLKYNRPF